MLLSMTRRHRLFTNRISDGGRAPMADDSVFPWNRQERGEDQRGQARGEDFHGVQGVYSRGKRGGQRWVFSVGGAHKVKGYGCGGGGLVRCDFYLAVLGR
ncbi:hypothetical protein QTP88_013416 [Uroleucon formosanum]